jgi:hypothetical protein
MKRRGATAIGMFDVAKAPQTYVAASSIYSNVSTILTLHKIFYKASGLSPEK